MNRLTRDGTAEPASREIYQILRRERLQGENSFPCSVDNAQDWQPNSVDPYSSKSYHHTYIHTELNK